MAAQWLQDLVTARDNMAAELRKETERRLALVQAGLPPPGDYSLDGKSMSWQGWLTARLQQLKEINDAVVKMGAEGIPEQWLKSY